MRKVTRLEAAELNVALAEQHGIWYVCELYNTTDITMKQLRQDVAYYRALKERRARLRAIRCDSAPA